MQSPWQEYYNQVNELFGKDPEIAIEFDDPLNSPDKRLTLMVENEEKADALAKILPFEREFGGVKLHIDIVPANKEPIGPEIIEKAFQGNPVFNQLIMIDDPQSGWSMAYCEFKKDVVQYWGDNLGDPRGNISTLYEDIAREVLDNPGVLFCTADRYDFENEE